MKNIFLTLFCGFGTVYCLAQVEMVTQKATTMATLDNQIANSNTDCDGAIDLCGYRQIKQHFNSRKGGEPCLPSITTVYYFFKTSDDGTFSIGNFSASVESTYQVLGPFDEFQDGCNLLNGGLINEHTSTLSIAYNIQANVDSNKYYLVEIKLVDCDFDVNFSINYKYLNCKREEIGCEDCIPQFNPGDGQYIISAWAKQADAAPSVTSYSDPHVKISFPSSASSFDFYASGQIIDGWQRIEGTFNVSSSGDMVLELLSDGAPCYFDDIRIFPFDGSMISYVYDPITLRLVAELDERNYAKIYEYDEEGKLIRVKKETEKGIMTIQENRENSVKQ